MEIFLQLHFSFSSENIFKFIKIIFLFRRPNPDVFNSKFLLNYSINRYKKPFISKWIKSFKIEMTSRIPDHQPTANLWKSSQRATKTQKQVGMRMIYFIRIKFKYQNVWHSWTISISISLSVCTTNIQDTNQMEELARELMWTILESYQEQCICLSVTMYETM